MNGRAATAWPDFEILAPMRPAARIRLGRHDVPRRLLVAIFVALVVSRANAQSLEVLNRDLTSVTRDCMEYVVRVEPGLSGVCVSRKGDILTHIAVAARMQAQKLETTNVRFADGTEFGARLVHSDPGTRTALLRIDARRNFSRCRPANTETLSVGNLALVIGNSFDSAAESAPACTLGVIASIRRDQAGAHVRYETSAATNPGQQGSPLFDLEGNLIGVILELPDGQDLATVTPIDRIRDLYDGRDSRNKTFEDPPRGSPGRSDCLTLSRAFAIAASRARSAVCSLVITIQDSTTTEAAEKDDSDKPPDVAPLVPPRSGASSGLVIDSAGYVIAPLSAITGDVESIEARLHDGRRFPATVIGRDYKSSLALLLLDKSANESLPTPLTTLDVTELRTGQFLVAVGAPNGDAATDDGFVTVGVLSSRHQLDPWRDALQTDAGINVKNAGGALVDLRGRLVGVILPPQAPFGQNSGLGFAMPVESIHHVVETMKSGRDIYPALLGVNLANLDTDKEGEGVRVTAVSEGLPADLAGMQPGDIIRKLDGLFIKSHRDLSDHLTRHKVAGDAISVTVERDGKTLQFTATLIRRS